jgi:arylsulfatase A-like enzyme
MEHGSRRIGRPAARGLGLLRYVGSVRRSVAGSLAVVLLGCGGGEPPRRFNLLLVSVDTLRADRLACYGGPRNVGRAICALADEGTRFQWAFSTAPHTGPSVASLLTSLYPATHRVTQNPRSQLAPEVVTLAEALAAAGYDTAAFISNPVLRSQKRLDQGFRVYDEHMPRRERNRPHFVERHARDTTDAAVAWVQAEAREPWFLWVHYQDPHGPYDPPGARPARDSPGARRLRLLRDHSGRGGIPAYQALPGVFSPAAYQRRYLDEVRFLDAEVARLLQRVDASGEPPAVLLTSDHGEAFGEDGYFFAHGHSVGLEQIRVPLLWRPPPGREGAGVVQTSVSLVDVAPTLLRLVGAALPDGMEGRPLPLAPGLRRAGGRPVFAQQARHVAVIRDGAYYARERTPGSGSGASGRRWGHHNPALPARTAELGPGPTLPGYRDAVGPPVADLERELGGYLGSTETLATPGAPPAGDVDPEIVEQLRALGYTGEE